MHIEGIGDKVRKLMAKDSSPIFLQTMCYVLNSQMDIARAQSIFLRREKWKEKNQIHY